MAVIGRILAIVCMVLNVIMMTVSIMAFITNQQNYILYRDTSDDRIRNELKYKAVLKRKRKYRLGQALYFIPKIALFALNIIWLMAVLE